MQPHGSKSTVAHNTNTIAFVDAARRGLLEECKAYLQQGLSPVELPPVESNRNTTIPIIASFQCERKDGAKIRDLLISSSENLNVIDNENNSLVVAAMNIKDKKERLRILKRILLEKRVNPNLPLILTRSIDRTALNIAIEIKDTECTRLLIDSGADVNAANRNGEKPLYLAIRYDQEEAMHSCIEKGASIFDTINLDLSVSPQPISIIEEAAQHGKWESINKILPYTMHTINRGNIYILENIKTIAEQCIQHNPEKAMQPTLVISSIDNIIEKIEKEFDQAEHKSPTHTKPESYLNDYQDDTDYLHYDSDNGSDLYESESEEEEIELDHESTLHRSRSKSEVDKTNKEHRQTQIKRHSFSAPPQYQQRTHTKSYKRSESCPPSWSKY